MCTYIAQVRPENVELLRRDYAANGGWETFLSYEDPGQDILVGLLRLRKIAGVYWRNCFGGVLHMVVPFCFIPHFVFTATGPAKTRQPELMGRCSVVRELHVYGTAVAVHARDASKQQHQVCSDKVSASCDVRLCIGAHCLSTHQGYGRLLMEEAERIAREEHGSVKLAVISGVGTRHYYRKLGYHLEGPYMVKHLV